MMKIEELVKKIYNFEGSEREWLEFEKEIKKEIDNLSEEENKYLTESEAMEHLLMVCDGIRFERSKHGTK